MTRGLRRRDVINLHFITVLDVRQPRSDDGNPWVVVSDDDRASATASEPSRPAAAGAASRPAAAGAASWSVPPGFSSATPEPRYTCPNRCKYCQCQCCRGEEVGHRHCRCHFHWKWR